MVGWCCTVGAIPTNTNTHITNPTNTNTNITTLATTNNSNDNNLKATYLVRRGSGKPPTGWPSMPWKNSTTLVGRDSVSACSTRLCSSRLFCTINCARSPTTLLLGVTCVAWCVVCACACALMAAYHRRTLMMSPMARLAAA